MKPRQGASQSRRSRGNGRTTKEGTSDLKFQNFALPKNRSWTRLGGGAPAASVTAITSEAFLLAGQSRTIHKPLRDDERTFGTVLDGVRSHSDDAYEDPELHVVDVWPSSKILPARPIKDSEYADTRYFKGAVHPSTLLNAKTPIPTEGQAWNPRTGLEEVNKPISKDTRNHPIKGDRPMKVNKTPLLPPRPPAILPKKYQPLPPEPENLRPCSQPHSFPDIHREPRQISLKDLSQVLEAEKPPHHQVTPEPSLLTQNQAIQEIPPGVPSSSFIVSSHGVQNRDHTGSLPSSVQRCQPSASYRPRENRPPCEPPSRRKPCPTASEQKDVQHSEWYIGQYGRQAVEEALMKERKDGTFLVRDCSTKSKAEPYVLVVFYGNKVYNVKIRFLERNQQFALGTGLRGDERFDSVEDIIQYYKSFPIILIDGKDKTGVHKEQCCLTRPLPLSRHFSPW
ncbi:cytokine-dependent hematopoietic cell linker [Ochotona curzoniae]|uniref:cytokine-dependent hematopoietic cell linker n=1 Tax=Ochotona curzoniae TaxID=130825 RepID=UPI001B349D2D|nr:cytokine-dependent hematopoietic cell linker [Ochotona curzoniae]